MHTSDCATNNGPAYPAGPCNCGNAVEHEIGDLIATAIDAGYDVVITITERTDGQPGTLTIPIAWINIMADRKVGPRNGD